MHTDRTRIERQLVHVTGAGGVVYLFDRDEPVLIRSRRSGCWDTFDSTPDFARADDEIEPMRKPWAPRLRVRSVRIFDSSH